MVLSQQLLCRYRVHEIDSVSSCADHIVCERSMLSHADGNWLQSSLEGDQTNVYFQNSGNVEAIVSSEIMTDWEV
ncbi:hypothetical protein RRG08_049390 [Elysia crispata]|uniref:Uncharacterized protein n=1 Tax=Elysia crispata TaxID=231223 RepID=A0AAE1CEL7_9GAST|nr:hypothetical protein RRG08_049390 [Elysia crispata]